MDVDDLLRELDDLAPSSSKPAGSAGHSRHGSSSAGATAGSSSPGQRTAAGTATSAASSRFGGDLDLGPSPPQGAASAPRGSFAPHHARVASAGTSHQGRPSLDELLEDLEHIPTASDGGGRSVGAGTPSTSGGGALDPSHPRLTKASSMSSGTTGTRQKCLSLWVSGTANKRGRSGVQVEGIVCCDSVRCTKCDFKVSVFNNKEWAAGVDYLFFRNNFPTEAKLAPMMLSKPGCCAYCCQCSWVSATSERKIEIAGDLRWICGGHVV